MSQHGCPERLSNRSKGFQEESAGQATMEVLVETLTGTAFEMTVSPSDTIFAIKSKIFRVEGKLHNYIRSYIDCASLVINKGTWLLRSDFAFTPLDQILPENALCPILYFVKTHHDLTSLMSKSL